MHIPNVRSSLPTTCSMDHQSFPEKTLQHSQFIHCQLAHSTSFPPFSHHSFTFSFASRSRRPPDFSAPRANPPITPASSASRTGCHAHFHLHAPSLGGRRRGGPVSGHAPSGLRQDQDERGDGRGPRSAVALPVASSDPSRGPAHCPASFLSRPLRLDRLFLPPAHSAHDGTGPRASAPAPLHNADLHHPERPQPGEYRKHQRVEQQQQ